MRKNASFLMLALAACGDPLVERGFRGDLLLRVDGALRALEGVRRPAELRASVFWSLNGRTSSVTAELAEHPRSAVAVTFPDEFTIHLFGPPNAMSGGAFEVGLVLVYEDVDQSGRLDLGELRGGAPNFALLYAPAVLTPDVSPTGFALEGYAVVPIPLPCRSQSSSRDTGDEECGVPLGAPCERDTDCGSLGACRRSGFEGGYCVLPQRENGCRPKNGVLGPGPFVEPAPGMLPHPPDFTDWYLACAGDQECRAGEGYECSYWLGICYPREPVPVDLNPGFSPAPLCAGP